MSAARRLPFGAEGDGAGHTCFRVWAPSCRRAAVVFAGGREEALAAERGGWFSGAFACPTGATYRYRFDGGRPVPDPAARTQCGGVDGASVVVDPRAYAWRHPDWPGRPWPHSVVYELHVGACGGFAGVRARLPRLRELGVTTIELMPLAEFGGARNWGYDGVLPFAPSAAYGSADELRALVDDAHGLGLCVLLDVVYNHFGPLGNYLAQYADAFFRDDVATPWGRAIDFRRPEVRAFFLANARHWLDEYRFDGLRLDAVHAIEPRDWLQEFAARLRASTPRTLHLVLENDANAAHLLAGGFDAQWNDDFHHALHVLLTGERESYYRDYADAPAQRLARVLAEGFAYQGEPSGFRGHARGEPSGALPPHAFVAFLQNHDQVGNRAFGERLPALASPAALRAATALLLLCPQVPLLWMGQEWGSRQPFLYFTDYHGELARAVCEGRRREFAAFAAFADAERRRRIPDPNAAATFVASQPDFARAEAGDGAHELARCHALLALRRRLLPDLATARPLGAEALGAAAVAARWRLGRRTLALFANFAATPVAVPPARGALLHETEPGAAAALRRGALRGTALVALLQDDGADE